MATDAVLDTEFEYPSSDGQPMAETGIHVRAMQLLMQALEDFFHPRTDVFLATDMFWYWRERDVEVRTTPDVMVVPGVGNHDRRTFNSFDEGGAIPAIVFEMASKSTWEEDETTKFDLYRSLGVLEYVLFDPENLYLDAPLKGYRLTRGEYRRIRAKGGAIESQLGFKMRAEGTMLRLIRTATNEPIPTRLERAEAAEHRAVELQAEVERLKAMLQTNGKSPRNGTRGEEV